MPPQLLFDISGIDLNKVIFDQEEIRKFNPQRGQMEHLNGIVHADDSVGQMVGFKDVRDDEFWVEGHIPGRPLLPGVIMIEAAAQVAAFYAGKLLAWPGFIGFGAADEIRFRQPVTPGTRMHILCLKISTRHRRCECKVQGLVNGSIVFEAKIVGVAV